MESNWGEIFKFYAEDRNRQYVSSRLAPAIESLTSGMEWEDKQRWLRIQDEHKYRGVRLLKSNSKYKVLKVEEDSPLVDITYRVHISWLIEHNGITYTEEWVEDRSCLLKQTQGWAVVNDVRLNKDDGYSLSEIQKLPSRIHELTTDIKTLRNGSPYDRGKAVQYAELWWNDYNPQFEEFDVDCTNFVSQCMWAGNAPMRHASREKGWWYKFGGSPNWSFSWSVAHALRLYLGSSQSGLRATEVFSADQLEPGDIICYDFDGDGRFQHNTIVVMKDGEGMPLVNAHTTNSRHRYWSYTDSHAWTEQVEYRFFRIVNYF
ncbi:amidase domain-containing protein [Bacillus horti]|uniref:Putative amidase domain-containing protein n=1 Tax=Caldalkalibacillus horti TaxID=77523 RepID=A0ABT9W002_9BACI|nr:amidase domain-containing protein [Bacillus horti]MDQ0166582.1 hypothetical protein [Bacillus horti]